MWTKEPPTRNGYYLWRISHPDEPPTVEPFMIFALPNGSQRVQELSTSREWRSHGNWVLSDWLYSVSEGTEKMTHRPAEYLFIGGPDTEWCAVRAFRELYHAAVSAWRDLKWTPDLSENGAAVMDELAAAISDIHKETN